MASNQHLITSYVYVIKDGIETIHTIGAFNLNDVVNFSCNDKNYEYVEFDDQLWKISNWCKKKKFKFVNQAYFIDISKQIKELE